MFRFVVQLFLSCYCLFLHNTTVVLGLDNGLASTPPMGISTWSIFRGNINHTLIVDLADSMVELGLRDAGYRYLLMDAGWAKSIKDCEECLPERDKDGRLVVDETKFPSIKETINHVHSRGLLFGIWFGAEMCAETNDDNRSSNPTEAIDDYAELDAKFFASIGVDAVKHDACGSVPNTTVAVSRNLQKYERMGLALNKTGRPILYDVTLQVDKPRTLPSYDYGYIWSPEPYGRENVQRIANTWWSVPVNKYNCWDCCVHPQEFLVPGEDCSDPHKKAARRGLLPMLDVQDSGAPGWEGHYDWAGPTKGWNHLDQLSVCVDGPSWYGPGLTRTEQVSQISLWAIVASPIIVSVDTRKMARGDFCHRLITNSLLITEVHQDRLGKPGRRMKNYYRENHNKQQQQQQQQQQIIETQLWARPLSNGRVAVVFFNRAEEERSMNATFEEAGLHLLAPSTTTVTTTDVWTGESNHGVSSPLTVTSIAPHGVVFLIVTPEDHHHRDDYYGTTTTTSSVAS